MTSVGKLRLTRAQRRGLFSRDKSVPWPVLAGEGVPPVAVGYTHTLSSRLRIEVTKVNRRRNRWTLEYLVHDDRETGFYLLPAARSLPVDEKGNVTPMPPEEEIGYSKNPKAPRADRARTVPTSVQNVIDMQGRLHQAERPASQAERNAQARSVREKLHQALDGLTPSAQTALLARIERDIAEAQEQDAEAA